MNDPKEKVSAHPETNSLNPSVNNIAKNRAFVKPFLNRGEFSKSACSVLTPVGTGGSHNKRPDGDALPYFPSPEGCKEWGGGCSSPKGNIIFDSIGHSSAKNEFLKYYLFDTYEVMRHRKDIFSMSISEIRAELGEIVDRFHKQFDIYEGEWIYSGYRKRKKDQWKYKVKGFKRQKDRKYNIYDAIDRWKYNSLQFERFFKKKNPNTGLWITGSVLNALTFTVPDVCVPVENKREWIKQLKKHIKYILNKNGIYNYVCVLHWWGDKNPMKTNIHFHILAKSNVRKYSKETLSKIRRAWAKVLRYEGEVDIDYGYFYMYRHGKHGIEGARHYYNYIIRPYVYDVFLWWLLGYNVNGWQDVLNIWYPKKAIKIRWYGRLTFKIEPDLKLDSDWEEMGRVELLGYEKENDILFAWFYWEQEFLKFRIPVSGGFI